MTLGEEVTLGKLRDFFERVGLLVEQVFSGLKQPVTMTLAPDVDFGRSLSKINAIMALRHVRKDLKLKDAVALVESPAGTVLASFDDDEDAVEALKEFERLHVKNAITLRDRDSLELKVMRCNPFAQKLVTP